MRSAWDPTLAHQLLQELQGLVMAKETLNEMIQYPLVIYNYYGTSPFSMGKITINCNFQ